VKTDFGQEDNAMNSLALFRLARLKAEAVLDQMNGKDN
jgi:hypothetical protein